MATIGNTFLNLIDMYKSAGGREAQLGEVVEVLRQLNPLMEDAVTAECNMGTFHRHMIRTGLPDRRPGACLYQGIPQSEVHHPAGRRHHRLRRGPVHGRHAAARDLRPIRAAVRLSEGRAYLEAMAQEVSEAASSTTTPRPRRRSSRGCQRAIQQARRRWRGQPDHQCWRRRVPTTPRSGSSRMGDDYTTLDPPQGHQGGRDARGQGRTAHHRRQWQYLLCEGGAVPPAYRRRRCATGATMRGSPISTSVERAGRLGRSLQAHAPGLLQAAGAARGQDGGERRRRSWPHRHLHEPRHAARRSMRSATNSRRTARTISSASSRWNCEGEEVLSYRGMPIRETDALINAESVVS